MADIYCNESLPDFVQRDCGVDRAGIIGVSYIKNSYNFDDLSDAAEWADIVSASPQLGWIIKQTRGEYAGGNAVEEEGFGKEATRYTGADHELTFEVEGIKENVNFFNKINGKKGYDFAWVTNGGLLMYVKNVVSFAKINNVRDIKAGLFFQVTVKWQDLYLPTVKDAPVAIFED